MKQFFALLAVFTLCSGMAFATATAVTVNFPSDTTWSSTAGGSDFFGNNGGLSFPMYTQGDYISETFVTGQPFVNALSVDWTVLDYFGNNSGVSYENFIYLNNYYVGSFWVGDCGFCNNLDPVTGTVAFNPIYGFGTYTLSVVLAQSAPSDGGAELFTELNSAGGPATASLVVTPEPGSVVLFASGLIGAAGMLRRRLSR